MENMGITTGKFIVGLVIAILASSAISVGLTQQLVTGQRGPAREKGDTGPQGATGLTGPIGETGSAGPVGATGAAGAVGPQGPSGPSGSSGSSGSSSSNMPDYDSGWINIVDKRGQYFDVMHNLNYTNVLVDIIGTGPDGSVHQKYLGLTERIMPYWNKTFGGTGSDVGRSIVQTDDGGYAVAGITNSIGFGSNDVYLIKTDPMGNMLWSKSYGGADSDSGNSLVQTADGGYAIAGSTKSFGSGNYDFYLVKTDANGNMLWNNTYGGTGNDYTNSVVQTSDGGYVLAGYTDSSGAGGIDLYLVKTDANGNMLWNNTYGGARSDLAYSLVQTNDGGYAMTGSTSSFGAGATDVYFVKTDANGNMLWNKTYGGTASDLGYSLVQTSDGGYAIAGYTIPSGAYYSDMWLVKTDSNANMFWNRTYGGVEADLGYCVVQASDGGYAISGWTRSFGYGSNDILLVKTDPTGNSQWSMNFGGSDLDFDGSLIETNDGSFAIAGMTNSTGTGNYDVYLIKTAFQGEFGLARTNYTANTLTLYRGKNDIDWDYVRVCIWKIE